MSFPCPLLQRFFLGTRVEVYVTEFDREATLNKHVAAKLEASFSTF